MQVVTDILEPLPLISESLDFTPDLEFLSHVWAARTEVKFRSLAKATRATGQELRMSPWPMAILCKFAGYVRMGMA